MNMIQMRMGTVISKTDFTVTIKFRTPIVGLFGYGAVLAVQDVEAAKLDAENQAMLSKLTNQTIRQQTITIILLAMVIIGMIVFPRVAHAGEATRCADTSAWARFIMEARQDGEPIERAYEMVGDVPMLQELVLQAYTRPRFLSYGFQVAEIDEFSNDTFMQCVRGEK